MVTKASTSEKLPPHDIEAEESLIASALVDPEQIPSLATIVSAEDFFREQNGAIWRAILSLAARDGATAVNQITIHHELARLKKLEFIGGPAYISRLVAELATSVGADHYAQIVLRCATYRRLISAASYIVRRAYEVDPEVERVLAEAITMVTSVSERGLTDRHVTSLADGLRKFIDSPPIAGQGILTGWTSLNRLLGSLRCGDLIIIAARPSKGKTSALMSLLRDVIVEGRKKAFLFSLEMSVATLITRLLAAQTGIDSRRLDQRLWDEREDRMVNHGLGVLADTSQWIDDQTRGLGQIELRAKAYQVKYGLDLVAVDYLQLIEVERRENRAQEVSLVSRRLKALARDMNVPIVALAQLSRAIESRADTVPLLSDLKESGSIEQDADVVMFLHDELKRPTSNRRPVSMIVAKHRNGPTVTVNVVFDPATSRFLEPSA